MIGVSNECGDKDQLVEDAMCKAYFDPSVTIDIDHKIDPEDSKFNEALDRVLNAVLSIYPKRAMITRRNNVPVDCFEHIMNAV